MDVDLGERAFVVGPNAAGKSNLLDALRFLRDVAAPEGGLQRAVAERGGVETVRFLGASANSSIVVQVTLDGGGSRWTYSLEFTSAGDRIAEVVTEIVQRNGETVLGRPDSADADDPLRLHQTALQTTSANYPFRAVSDFLAKIAYLHLTPEFLRDRKRIRPQVGDPFGSDLLDRVAQTRGAVREKRMKRINTILRAALPQLDRIDIDSGDSGAPHLDVRFKNWRATARAQNEQQLSDGTLRLFGFLWMLMDGEGPLLMEEPELSLHPGVVRHLATLAFAESRRQTIISTHSLDLLADEGIGPEEVLLLEPGADGTRVILASDDTQIRALLEGGMSVADAVMPATAPPRSTDMMRAGS